MMLQRTKADQVVPVYLKLLNKYPIVGDLAEADLGDLQNILNPLGLAWRISKFKEMAKALVDRFNGIVPEKREELTSLPGVGDYVSGAVLSIAFQKPEWVVDSNIVRLFRRHFGIQTSSEGRRDAHVIELAKRSTSKRRPRETTLAILDFTALVCTPALPRHDICPLKSKCVFFNTQAKEAAADNMLRRQEIR
jgi:A/G-specific adenine glycosylase